MIHQTARARKTPHVLNENDMISELCVMVNKRDENHTVRKYKFGKLSFRRIDSAIGLCHSPLSSEPAQKRHRKLGTMIARTIPFVPHSPTYPFWMGGSSLPNPPYRKHQNHFLMARCSLLLVQSLPSYLMENRRCSPPVLHTTLVSDCGLPRKRFGGLLWLEIPTA